MKPFRSNRLRKRRRGLLGGFVVVGLLGLLQASSASAGVLLAHLPSAPIENASRFAGAVDDLSAHLNSEVSGLDLETQIFRRLSDVEAYLQANSDQVVLLLSESSLLLDPSVELTPAYQFQRDGRQTYRRLLVVKASRSEQRLSELRGVPLELVETARGGAPQFLRRAAFGDELDPSAWFGPISLVSDDFVATADVLYDKAEAALIAEHNPLVQAQIGKELRVVYTSEPLPLPVLSLRDSSLSAAQRSALTSALQGLASSDAGRSVLNELMLEAIVPLTEASARALRSLPSPPAKRLEVALPDLAAARAAASALPLTYEMPKPSDLHWTIELALPELKIDSTAVDAKDRP